MSGFLGWIGARGDAVDTARISSSLPPGGVSRRIDLSPNSGLVLKRSSEPISTWMGERYFVVVDGKPRWTNRELVERAEQSGHAAAIEFALSLWNTSSMRQIRGSYAFALMDLKSNSAFLAIDRFGIRPLAFARTKGNGLIFGSTTQAVRQHPAIDAHPNPQAVYDYFFFHVVPSPETVYSEILKLEPSQCLWHGEEKTVTREYWAPVFAGDDDDTGGMPHPDRLMDPLRAAVERLDTEGERGVYLSGGLDSSTVAGLVSESAPRPVRAYCIGFPEPKYNEMLYARIAARHFNLDLHEIFMSPEDVVHNVSKIAAAYDEPFGNSSAVPAFLCAQRAAQDGLSYLLAGDGGDELFAGNAWYAKQKIFQLYFKIPTTVRRKLLERSLACGPDWISSLPLLRKLKSYIDQAKIEMPDRIESDNIVNKITPQNMFDRGFLDMINTEHPYELLRKRYRSIEIDSLLKKMLFLDWKFTLADNDLRKVTRTAQLSDIAVFYPMLDDDLVDFSASIASKHMIKGLRLRHFYRDSLASYLPKAIIQKKKHGFGLPFGQWLLTSSTMQEMVDTSLRALMVQGFFRDDFIDSLMRKHEKEHPAYYGVMIWVLAIFEHWQRAHRFSL